MQLYDAIGAFLNQHRLSPDPRHYAFAFRVLSEPEGIVAQSVAAMTEGGIRLSSREIQSLGGEIGALNVAAPLSPATAADGLVAQTQMQVEGFTDMMQAIRAETQGFGRDLAASADAMGSGKCRTRPTTANVVSCPKMANQRSVTSVRTRTPGAPRAVGVKAAARSISMVMRCKSAR